MAPNKLGGAGYLDLKPQPQDYGNSRYRTQVIKIFDLYEQRLKSSAYVAGPEYTIADIAAWPWLRNNALLGIDLAKYPALTKYVATIGERAAAKKMLSILPTIKSSRDNPTDDNRDKFFSRGKYALA